MAQTLGETAEGDTADTSATGVRAARRANKPKFAAAGDEEVGHAPGEGGGATQTLVAARAPLGAGSVM